MTESMDSESTDDKKAAQSELLESLEAWTSWLQQSAVIGHDILHLLRLELQLAFKDSKRLLVLALLFIPVAMLAWIGFSVLSAWLIYSVNTSVAQGLLAFFAFQITGLLALIFGWKHYRKSLRLPMTTEHVGRLLKGNTRDT